MSESVHALVAYSSIMDVTFHLKLLELNAPQQPFPSESGPEGAIIMSGEGSHTRILNSQLNLFSYHRWKEHNR